MLAELMTLYEFRCSAGNEPIEALFPLGKAPDEIPCEEHNSIARRQVSRGAFLTVPGAHNASYRSS